MRGNFPEVAEDQIGVFVFVGVDGAPGGMRCTTTGCNVETAKAKKEEKICRHENNKG